jgi:hypothetical protein
MFRRQRCLLSSPTDCLISSTSLSISARMRFPIKQGPAAFSGACVSVQCLVPSSPGLAVRRPAFHSPVDPDSRVFKAAVELWKAIADDITVVLAGVCPPRRISRRRPIRSGKNLPRGARRGGALSRSTGRLRYPRAWRRPHRIHQPCRDDGVPAGVAGEVAHHDHEDHRPLAAGPRAAAAGVRQSRTVETGRSPDRPAAR